MIPVDKPRGATSRRVVDAVARALGTKAVGHAGTLDPLASGVVVACVGPATRLVDFLHALPKRYVASFLLGRSSPSDDLETPVEMEADPPRPGVAAVEAALAAFRGDILQRPCDYSAVHVAGQRAYAVARKGRPVDLAAKRVRIERLEITAYDWPRLGLAVECSTGTFVRAIGRDLAVALGTRAVMESLVREAVGPFTLAQAIPLDALAADTVRAAVLPALVAVAHLPRIAVSGATLDTAVRGGLVELAAPLAAAPAVAAVDDAGELIGILARHGSGRHRLKPNFRGAGA